MKDARIVFTLGFCGICAIISAVSFPEFHNTAIGWLFPVITVGVAVLAIFGESLGTGEECVYRRTSWV